MGGRIVQTVQCLASRNLSSNQPRGAGGKAGLALAAILHGSSHAQLVDGKKGEGVGLCRFLLAETRHHIDQGI